MEPIMSQPLADRMAEYSAGLRSEDLPQATVHETKRRLPFSSPQAGQFM
jgi:hypothetical protein